MTRGGEKIYSSPTGTVDPRSPRPSRRPHLCTSSMLSRSCLGESTLYELSLIRSLKFSCRRVSTVVDDAIRVPSVALHTTLSMPLSSFFSISMKSPTVFEIGFSVNLHFSLLLGSGTVIWGRPRWYSIVTSETTTKLITASNLPRTAFRPD
jgi:hypothetical protein